MYKMLSVFLQILKTKYFIIILLFFSCESIQKVKEKKNEWDEGDKVITALLKQKIENDAWVLYMDSFYLGGDLYFDSSALKGNYSLSIEATIKERKDSISNVEYYFIDTLSPGILISSFPEYSLEKYDPRFLCAVRNTKLILDPTYIKRFFRGYRDITEIRKNYSLYSEKLFKKIHQQDSSRIIIDSLYNNNISQIEKVVNFSIENGQTNLNDDFHVNLISNLFYYLFLKQGVLYNSIGRDYYLQFKPESRRSFPEYRIVKTLDDIELLKLVVSSNKEPKSVYSKNDSITLFTENGSFVLSRKLSRAFINSHVNTMEENIRGNNFSADFKIFYIYTLPDLQLYQFKINKTRDKISIKSQHQNKEFFNYPYYYLKYCYKGDFDI